jgi:NAD(P)-dependent dehydrogenase (short-subunit alcohol dehydrogenase family)
MGIPISPRLLLFGCTGAIGSAISGRFRERSWKVVGVTRQLVASDETLRWNPLDAADANGREAVKAQAPYEAVCWAQGLNCNDSIYDFNTAVHEELYRANVCFVLSSMHYLVDTGLLAKPARLCVISSIWQNMARQHKLSYCVTKAALQGLVLSAANDLGRDGHFVNAVLPGVLDTPMTRRNLTPDQVHKVEDATQFGRLPTLSDVASTVYFLCSDANTGVTGQFVKVDLGFADVRII